MSDRREAHLLLAILREDWEAAATLTRGGSFDTTRFLSLCRACDVHPTVHAVLEREQRFGLVGDPVREALARLRHKVRLDNLLLLARLEQALDVLASAGIVPVVLKGIDVVHRFGIPFDARTLDDVDFLVNPREVGRVLSALEGAGFVAPSGEARLHWLRSSHEIPLESPGPVGVAFEVHWGLGQEFRYRVPTEELLARALPLEVAGRQVLRLEPHDAVAHLLLHHVQHYFDRRLKWALDLRRIASEPGFDWRIVAERLASWGGSAAGGMALRHIARLLPGAVSPAAARLVPASVVRLVLTAPLRSSHPLDWFAGTRRRGVQLLIAAALYEHPLRLPSYILHRKTRDLSPGEASPERYFEGPTSGAARRGPPEAKTREEDSAR
jgi:hypothetical protein